MGGGDVRGQIVEIGSLRSSCGSWESNLGRQAWLQEPLPGMPTGQSYKPYFESLTILNLNIVIDKIIATM